MAHHQKHHPGRVMSDLAVSPFGSRHVERSIIPEDEEAPDVDEPPEQHIQFTRNTQKPHTPDTALVNRQCRSHSLLTQGLLISPNLRSSATFDSAMLRAQSTASNDSAISGVSTAELTSDGGMTSPARTSTPSPPLPSALDTGLALIPSKTLDSPVHDHHDHEPAHISFKLTPSHTAPVVALKEPQPNAPRKRCITFACSTPRKEQPKDEPKNEAKPAEEFKRPRCLKFAVPQKPSRETEDKAPQSPRLRRASPAPSKMLQRKHRDSQSTIKEEKSAPSPKAESSKISKKSNPEGLRFHEFAPSKPQEEAWINATPTLRHKLTVTDCLRKENAIRKIGQEAEDEALEEEEEEEAEDLEDEIDGLDDEDDDDNDDEDEDDDDEDEEDEDSDGGNETDDEEGFADSDDESDAGSDFQFWTPATTTAATSVEHLEHIRPRQHRTASESSIDSTSERGVPIEKKHGRHHKAKRMRGSPKMRPGTPELPDSTDFVCGTLDEDQPLEAAYLSCMEQRRIAKHGLLPQDVDPSFPTSDPEQEEDDEDEDELGDSDSHAWIPGRPDDIDDTPHRGRAPSVTQHHNHHPTKSPMPSPKRQKSPAPKRAKSPAPKRAKSPAPQPTRRGIAIHSPAPRRLFGRSPAPFVSPPTQLVRSPPSSRRNSPNSEIGEALGPHHLAQRPRPQLTHTKSLPRTPNPFWSEHRRRRLAEMRGIMESDGLPSDGALSSAAAAATGATDGHSRGPIDIVQGLEHKRQRRKEKFWRQHCRHAAKDKEKARRPQPGKGAERMRELGLEVADRTKAYGQRLQLVLSV